MTFKYYTLIHSSPNTLDLWLLEPTAFVNYIWTMSIVPRHLSSAARLYKEWVEPLILLPKEMAIRFDRKKRPGIDHRFANPLPAEEALNQTKLRAEERDEARMVMTSLQHLALSLEDTHETIQRVEYIGAIKKAGKGILCSQPHYSQSP